MIARVLAIGGSDSGGGAGIQADIKTITALGGYAASAITALTAQNTAGVHGVMPVPADFVRAQVRAVLEDIGADAIKTGMLANEDIIVAVADELRERRHIPLIVDPVTAAKGGASLLESRALGALKRDLLLLATLITPNIPEAEELTGLEIEGLDGMRHAAEMMLTFGAKAVLVKGGHLGGEVIPNVLLSEQGEEIFEGRRVKSRSTHGTGCTLASAIAIKLAQSQTLPAAVSGAIDYVAAAVAEAPGLGRGHGPLAHVNSKARALP